MAEITLQGGAHAGLLFTGDIGRVRDQDSAPGKVVLLGAAEAEAADILVMESTYGNRSTRRKIRGRSWPISSVTRRSWRQVVVPAFAVERTQKFIFILKELMESGQIPRVPVFCDSPMAIKAVEVFLKHTEEYSDATKLD